MRSLSQRQREILRYIIKTIEEQGGFPALRAIAAEFGINSVRGASAHVEALEEKGYIDRSNRVTGPTYRVLLDEERRPIALRFIPVEGPLPAPELPPGIMIYESRIGKPATFSAKAVLRGKTVYLGKFKTIEEAVAARTQAIEEDELRLPDEVDD